MSHHKKSLFSIFLLGLAIYLLFPTPDEIFFYPTLGFIISELFSTSQLKGQIISAIIYRTIGIISLILAILIGGKSIYKKFEKKIKSKFNTYKNYID
ncbi:MAG: hypothetical protein WDZ62_00310 [Candidatus Pacearchaeota archaeon]